jgi:hypothetical protein
MLAAAACGGKSSDATAPTPPDANGTQRDSAEDGADGGAGCCPISDPGNGCVNLGGAGQGAACAPACDFWCSTNWRVETDDAGCQVWNYDTRSPGPGENQYCMLVDAGDGGGSGEAGAGRIPVNHRANADPCAAPRPAGNCTGGTGVRDGGFMCLQDSDCTAGKSGRCGNPGGPAGCYCSYDTCTLDTDCPTGQTCACHGSPYNSFGNTCVPGNCRVDADCGAGGYCSPTAPAGGWCGSVGGHYCHTPNDLCVDDRDCPAGTPGEGFCEYSTTNGRWECRVVAVCL